MMWGRGWRASAAASMETDNEPIAVGVISVNRRMIPAHNGFLGVALPDPRNDTEAKILQVVVDSPAERAGLKVGDVVVAVDGRAMRTGLQLRTVLQNSRPGKEVKLGLMRGGGDGTQGGAGGPRRRRRRRRRPGRWRGK